MGTTYSVKIVKNDSLLTEDVYTGLKPKVDNILTKVNKQMSTYMRESEISRFNDFSDTNWFPISKDFAEVVETALEIGIQSDSALDITVGGLVNLWGFGPDRKIINIPDDQEIDLFKSLTGLNKIPVRTSPPSIKKSIAEMSCDVSSIAKGFGVDKV